MLGRSDEPRQVSAFEQPLTKLSGEHSGEFGGFHGGLPVGFFADFGAADGAGVERFGLEEPFVVAQVQPVQAASLSVDSLRAGA